MQALEGRFVLSINDVPQIREIFAWAETECVETTYTIGGGAKAKRVAELLITDTRGGRRAPAWACDTRERTANTPPGILNRSEFRF